MDYQIVKATTDYTEKISAIECIAFSDPWSEDMISHTLESEMNEVYIALTSDGSVAGYAFLSVILDESTLENIAVHPDHRRKGIAGVLLGHIIGRARERGAEIMYLEVRKSNEAARSLYKSAGFEDIALRTNYYRNPTEDAVIMRKIIDQDKSSEEIQ